MLKWIREFRFDLKTTLILLALALAGWGVVVYVNVKEFIPVEYRAVPDSTEGR
ncbi:MAG: hypothetical protein OEZ65_14155 [Gemmatimonadota bacterium]|nr:hypothetical protein [Gemmatimonadota bacterium]